MIDGVYYCPVRWTGRPAFGAALETGWLELPGGMRVPDFDIDHACGLDVLGDLRRQAEASGQSRPVHSDGQGGSWADRRFGPVRISADIAARLTAAVA